MELRQLRCFVAVAEELHFGRAATRLNLSQPPLTRTIQQLETELGLVLLERTKRRVELTAAGRAFLERSKRILSLSQEAVVEAKRVSEGLGGTLSVSFVGSAMYILLPAVLREMHKRYPGVEIELHEMATDQQVSALLDYKTQAALIRPGIVHPMLRSQVVLRETLAIALPRSHPLANRRSVSLRQIADDPFILFPRQTHGSLGNRILDLCGLQGFTPRIVQEALEMQTALGLVAGGLGVAVVPGGVRDLSWPGIVLVPMPRPAPTIDLSLAHHREEASPLLPRFLEIVLETASRVKT
ncbi:MAG TPA: LysR substrate-binding domain-containing protein [Fibrobacteria bacterium]|nr:LysR substrate-binding domain-containing protein [Fibrobacteria bacterium]